MLTLWDLLDPHPKPVRNPGTNPRARPSRPTRPRTTPEPKPRATDKYLAMERAMLARYAVRVRKWRTNSSGVAWQVFYRDGSVTRLIESPRPRGPVSAAIFLHEIGHHAIGFDRYKVRCVEEYQAWRFALEQMELHAITITPRVRTRVADSLQYAIDKAKRRGLRAVPHEVAACIAEQRRLAAQSLPSPKRASMNAPGSKG